MRIVILFLFLCGPAFSQACPDAPDISQQRDALLGVLSQTGSPTEAQPVASELWLLWRTAPDAQAQDLLDRGIARREAYDFEDSENILDELIAYCPEYSEGYNQRAFTRFLRDKLDRALEDLDKTLETEPNHFGALSGKAIIFMRMGRTKLGQSALRRALAVHPWLAERAMLMPDTSIEL